MKNTNKSRDESNLYSLGPRAQLSIIMILGIIIFLTILLASYFNLYYIEGILKPEIYEGNELSSQFDSINQYINFCIESVTKPKSRELSPIHILASQGGRLSNLSSSLAFKGDEINILCTQKENTGCVNHMLLKSQMEEDLNLAVKLNLLACIDLDDFTVKGYNLDYDPLNLTVSTTIAKDNIFFQVNYPISVSQPEATRETQLFQYKLSSPLGRLFEVALDVLNSEIQYGDFNKDNWMIDNNALVKIQKHRPYPDIIYALTKDDITFQFAIKGLNTVGKIYPDLTPRLSSCVLQENCYSNTPENLCIGKLTPSCSMHQVSSRPRNFENCETKNHGESWCNYDSVTGEGTDYVGSRHYKESCIDGNIITEECRDFREELCTEGTINGSSTATCRRNRWQDCFTCTNGDCCTNTSLRDCMWKSHLKTDRKCIPYVPPGLRFWDKQLAPICSVANQKAVFPGLKVSNSWIDSTAILCYSQGDCGDYRNIADAITKIGFRNSDGEAKEYVYRDDGLQGQDYVITLPLTSTHQEPLLSSFSPPSNYPTAQEIAVALKRLKSYNPKPFDIFRPKEIKRPAISKCDLWQPPTNPRCDKCGEGICSEYRCRSLGELCEFSNSKGIPRCFEAGKGDKKPPQITIASLSNNYTYTKTTLGSKNKIWFKGYKVTPNIHPYSPFTFKIKTSEPSRCKITYLPEGNFDTLPALWFGDNNYKSVHNITIRLPSQIDIPNALFTTLNLSSINNLIDLPGFVTDVTKLASIKLLDEFKLGKYYLFLKCNDRSGNENDEEFFINFEVSKDDDTAPPVIVSTLPKPNSIVSNKPNLSLKLFLNEPSNCKASILDNDYDAMDIFFNCATSEYDLNDLYGGTYECSKLIPYSDKYYIRCIDNPIPERSFYISLLEKDNFSLASGSNKIIFSNLTIFVPDINLIENTKVYTYFNPTLHFNITGGANCKYSTSDQPFELMVKSFKCINETCSTRLNILDNVTDYTIKCRAHSDKLRNSNTESFELNLNKSDGFNITKVSPSVEVNSIKPTLQVWVSKNITHDNIKCSYTLDQEYHAMIFYNNSFYKKLSDLENFKEYLYRIKCTNNMGDIELSQTRFTVVI